MEIFLHEFLVNINIKILLKRFFYESYDRITLIIILSKFLLIINKEIMFQLSVNNNNYTYIFLIKKFWKNILSNNYIL